MQLLVRTHHSVAAGRPKCSCHALFVTYLLLPMSAVAALLCWWWRQAEVGSMMVGGIAKQSGSLAVEALAQVRGPPRLLLADKHTQLVA